MQELPDSPRLRFRELALGDLDFVAAMLADAEVMRYYPKVYTRDEAREWIERQRRRYSEHGHGLWLVLGRLTGMPVGQVGLLEQQVNGRQESEVGYLVQRAFWRHGLATEAARATRDWAFVASSWVAAVQAGDEGSLGLYDPAGPSLPGSTGVAQDDGFSAGACLGWRGRATPA